MDVTTLSQWQFAVTSVYHFFFVPLTIGLSILVAIMETIYFRTGNEIYKKMTKFWGKLFLINFAMGVVTGIVMEFQFGMNWANYSRYVGDIFGAPLAIEALLAFFLESTFLGLWIFGWDKLSRGWHTVAIWLVALGSNISALWILIANSFMQQPQGYALENGRAIMTDFGALVFNPNVWYQFPHVLFSGLVTASFFVMGVSAYHLLRKTKEDAFNQSFRIASIAGIVAALMVVLVGHSQAQHMVQTQPMKMAAAEALWKTENPASFSLLSIVDEKNKTDIVNVRIPNVLSLLAYNQMTGEVKGIDALQAEYETKYGPGNYIPPITISYWSFRIMVGLGFLMLALAAWANLNVLRNKPIQKMALLSVFPIAIFFPYLSNSFGWILTEIGRQPWVVFGLLKTADAASPTLTGPMVLVTLIGFTLVYGALMVVDVYLLVKSAKAGFGAAVKGKKSANAEETYWE